MSVTTLNVEKKPWKGFTALQKPNEFACNYCKNTDSDWVALEIKPPLYVHKICFFRSSHYGMNPAEHSKWRREYMKVRPIVLERDDYTCQMCKNECVLCKRDLENKGRINLQVHHIIPVKEGGSNDPCNLLTLCAFCNQIADGIQRKKNRKLSNSLSSLYPQYIKELFRAIDSLSKK